jgi:hypothetical protein
MKKKTKADITNSEPSNRRKLGLSREMVRVLDPSELAHAAGGCDSTTTPTLNETSHR